MSSDTSTLVALTLKAYDYQEADRLLHVFCAEFGPRTVLVKGARKPASKLSGACDPLMVSQLEVFSGRQFARLKRYETVKAFFYLRQDLTRLAMAHVLADWLRSLSGEEDVNARPAFEIAVDTLGLLDQDARAQASMADSLLRLLAAQVGLLREAGYLPEVLQTVDTGEFWETAGSPLFSLEWGGLVANGKEARQHGHTLIQLKPSTLATLQSLVSTATTSTEPLRSLANDQTTLLRVEKFLRFYVEQRIRQPLKSHEFMLSCLTSQS